jgi:hypothetical protein
VKANDERAFFQGGDTWPARGPLAWRGVVTWLGLSSSLRFQHVRGHRKQRGQRTGNEGSEGYKPTLLSSRSLSPQGLILVRFRRGDACTSLYFQQLARRTPNEEESESDRRSLPSPPLSGIPVLEHLAGQHCGTIIHRARRYNHLQWIYLT